uniref:Uncharacterized protein n=1 Tax=Zea mays TaxID=4577 RepID=B4FNR0_MAIZE|nr:unknown [Zea mays]
MHALIDWLPYRSEDDGTGEALDTEALPSRARRRYSSHPMSPLRPMRLFPYPSGLAGPHPHASLAACGDAKNLTASASSRSTTPAGTPWLTTLKKPKRSHASTTARAAPGLERSTAGTPGKEEASPGCGDRSREIWSRAGGFARTTIIYIYCQEEAEQCTATSGTGGGVPGARVTAGDWSSSSSACGGERRRLHGAYLYRGRRTDGAPGPHAAIRNERGGSEQR